MLDTKSIFEINSEVKFTEVALAVFKHQFENNTVYRSFCDLLYINPSDINSVEAIPFLPIQFFKTHKVLSTTNTVKKIFTSSGTTGKAVSKHYVTDLKLYEKSFFRGFEKKYGTPEDYIILALLPSYLERDGSSLIYMVNALIKQSKQPESGFYLDNLSELKKVLIRLDTKGKKVLLIGVSFALLDLVELYQFNLKHTIIMETGGMKGRRKELIREELHHVLKKGFGVDHIHSEYGMTELLSQAYSNRQGIFTTPYWMKIVIRDPEDALTLKKEQKSGGINIIDLANINSCAFIATQDLGRKLNTNTFEVIGRFDASDLRGCNLMLI